MGNRADEQYQGLQQDILDNGHQKGDRTGTGTISVFGREMRFKMSDGFPLLTTKKIYTKGVIHELLWMLGAMDSKYDSFGNTNIRYLLDNDVKIWVGDSFKAYDKKIDGRTREIMGYPTTEEEFIEKIKTDSHFAMVYGELGPIYGKQWTAWTKKIQVVTDINGAMSVSRPTEEINQIQKLIDDLKKNPDSRRLMVNAWNVGEIKNMTLPPCHYGFQCYTRELDLNERMDLFNRTHPDKSIDDFANLRKGEVEVQSLHHQHERRLNNANIPTRALSLKMTQRSCDTLLGVPFNIASYSILLHMIAQCVNMMPDEFIWSGGDVHIYNNHIEQCKEQISREPRDLPTIKLNPEIKNIFDFRFEDIEIEGYDPHPPIKGSLSN